MAWVQMSGRKILLTKYFPGTVSMVFERVESGEVQEIRFRLISIHPVTAFLCASVLFFIGHWIGSCR